MNENTIKVKLFRARQKLVKAAERLGKAPLVGARLNSSCLEKLLGCTVE